VFVQLSCHGIIAVEWIFVVGVFCNIQHL